MPRENTRVSSPFVCYSLVTFDEKPTYDMLKFQYDSEAFWFLALTSDVSVFTAFTKIYVYGRPHEDAHKRRFQIYPLWRAFSNLCVYSERFHRLCVDGRPKRIKKFAFTSVCVYNRLRVDGA